MSSKCGLGTGPMWSECARVTPEVVTDAGSNESDNLGYDRIEGLWFRA